MKGHDTNEITNLTHRLLAPRDPSNGLNALANAYADPAYTVHSVVEIAFGIPFRLIERLHIAGLVHSLRNNFALSSTERKRGSGKTRNSTAVQFNTLLRLAQWLAPSITKSAIMSAGAGLETNT